MKIDSLALEIASRVIDNVDEYSADYNICMIQDEDGINVSKY